MVGATDSMLEGGAQASGSGSPNNLVSWQSAFWALVAVILNILLQNAGAVAGSYEHRIALRSSPIVCAVDTLFCIVKFIWMVSLGCAPSVAARHVWYDRFTDCPSFESSGIDKMWRLNMIAFILGALPQVIKILAMRGIPLTQTLAAILLVAFVVPEILRMVAGQVRSNGLPPVLRIERTKRNFTKAETILLFPEVACQVGLCIWVLSRMMPPSWYLEKGGHPWSKYDVTITSACRAMMHCVFILVVSLVALVLIWLAFRFVQSIAVDAWFVEPFSSICAAIIDRLSDIFAAKRTHIQMVWMASFCTGRLCFAGFVYHFIFNKAFNFLDEEPYKVVAMARVFTALFFMLVSGLLLHAVYRPLFMGAFSEYPRGVVGIHCSLKDFWAFVFLVLNFSTLFIYYNSLFSSEGTFKPSWTDKLG